MVLSHNQMAYAAIVSTLIFGSLFVGASGFFQTSEDFGDFESAADDDITGGGTNAQDALDTDGDGILIPWKPLSTERCQIIPIRMEMV